MFETIAGLPAHPLFVHVAVVAVPIAAIVAMSAAFRYRGLNTQLNGWAAIISVLALGGVFIARSSGEAFLPSLGLSEENPGIVQTHANYATYSLIVTAILTVLSILMWFLARRGTTPSEHAAVHSDTAAPAGVMIGLRFLLFVAAVAALVLVIMTGHEGATLVWK